MRRWFASTQRVVVADSVSQRQKGMDLLIVIKRLLFQTMKKREKTSSRLFIATNMMTSYLLVRIINLLQEITMVEGQERFLLYSSPAETGNNSSVEIFNVVCFCFRLSLSTSSLTFFF